MGIGRKEYNEVLFFTAQRLRAALHLKPEDTIDTGIVLGTGWAEAFTFDARHRVPLTELDGPFETIEPLDGHERCYEIGTVCNKQIIALRGRVHMNEFTFNPAGKLAVRAQIELMIGLGVKTLILTAAVGSLMRETPAGSVIAINGWISGWSEEMPLFGGEFVDPESALFQPVDKILLLYPIGLNKIQGRHIFWRGPHFEGMDDKGLMRQCGARCVGMSIKPETAVAALHPSVRVIPLGLVTDAPGDKMTHEHNREIAKASALKLGELLTNIVNMLDS